MQLTPPNTEGTKETGMITEQSIKMAGIFETKTIVRYRLLDKSKGHPTILMEILRQRNSCQQRGPWSLLVCFAPTRTPAATPFIWTVERCL